MKKLFYNFKDKKFIVKDLNFDMHNKEAWIGIEEKPFRKDDCYFLGEMRLEVCGKFASYVREKERICVRDEPFPDLAKVLKYFKEWKENVIEHSHNTNNLPMTKEYVVEVSATIKRVALLFSLGFEITNRKNIHETYYFSVITEILIHLNDLAQKLKNLDNGIYFTDDIPVTNDYKDITSLVRYFRNAACHNGSPNRRTQKGFLYANNVFAGDEYPDDITIIMGNSKLFVNRHLVRLYKETLRKFVGYEELHSNANFKYAIGLAQYLNYIE